MTTNMVTPLECPSCGEYDQCYVGCSCPMCFIGREEIRSEALTAWKKFAPLMLKLTQMEIGWCWSCENGKYSLTDITTDETSWLEIYLIGNTYCIDITEKISGEHVWEKTQWVTRTVWQGEWFVDCASYTQFLVGI